MPPQLRRATVQGRLGPTYMCYNVTTDLLDTNAFAPLMGVQREC